LENIFSKKNTSVMKTAGDHTRIRNYYWELHLRIAALTFVANASVCGALVALRSPYRLNSCKK
jgi:hypothetical protein